MKIKHLTTIVLISTLSLFACQKDQTKNQLPINIDKNQTLSTYYDYVLDLEATSKNTEQQIYRAIYSIALNNQELSTQQINDYKLLVQGIDEKKCESMLKDDEMTSSYVKIITYDGELEIIYDCETKEVRDYKLRNTIEIGKEEVKYEFVYNRSLDKEKYSLYTIKIFNNEGINLLDLDLYNVHFAKSHGTKNDVTTYLFSNSQYGTNPLEFQDQTMNYYKKQDIYIDLPTETTYTTIYKIIRNEHKSIIKTHVISIPLETSKYQDIDSILPMIDEITSSFDRAKDISTTLEILRLKYDPSLGYGVYNYHYVFKDKVDLLINYDGYFTESEYFGNKIIESINKNDAYYVYYLE